MYTSSPTPSLSPSCSPSLHHYSLTCKLSSAVPLSRSGTWDLDGRGSERVGVDVKVGEDRGVEARVLDKEEEDVDLSCASGSDKDVVVELKGRDAGVGQEELHDLDVSVLGRPVESKVVLGRRIHAVVLEEKVDRVQVTRLASNAERIILHRSRVNAGIVEENADDGCLAVLTGCTNDRVAVRPWVDAAVGEEDRDDLIQPVLCCGLEKIIASNNNTLSVSLVERNRECEWPVAGGAGDNASLGAVLCRVKGVGRVDGSEDGVVEMVRSQSEGEDVLSRNCEREHNVVDELGGEGLHCVWGGGGVDSEGWG